MTPATTTAHLSGADIEALIEKAARLDALQAPLASLLYDVGQLPYRVMRDEACGKSLFASFEAVTALVPINER